MTFRTEIKPLPGVQGLIDHESTVCLIGSCFSDNIGALLARDGFDVFINPLGTLYSPASISHSLTNLLKNKKTYSQADTIERDGRYCSLDFHSSFSASSPQELSDLLNHRCDALRKDLPRVRTAIITLGSVRHFLYPCGETLNVAANCHKLPNSFFTEASSTLEQTETQLRNIIHLLRGVNPKMHLIFTVSPVRHKADLHLDRLSKSTLLLAVEKMICEFDDIHYFPAYEIVNDDLRDYRFYAADMLHPSEVAVEYIYSIFSQTYFTPETIKQAASCRAATLLAAHRPLA